VSRFRLRPEALAEFEEAVDYYLELSPEVASRFVDAFEAAVNFARENPRLWCGFEVTSEGGI
jgi:plasmid stabilization system protein ParE